MKKLVIMTTLSLFSTFAFSGELDGLTFCRQVKSGGMFGQPSGIRNHCVSFGKDLAKDNANTFFGNPPEIFSYRVEGGIIINSDKNTDSGYEVQGNDIIIRETGAVLIRQ